MHRSSSTLTASMEPSPKITTSEPGLPATSAKANGHSRGREQSPGHLNNSLESAKSLISPSIRFPLPRALSPDLPTRDALYLFCNFSSYMRSPHEGAEGIRNHEDFRDTIRLLDHARVGLVYRILARFSQAGPFHDREQQCPSPTPQVPVFRASLPVSLAVRR